MSGNPEQHMMSDAALQHVDWLPRVTEFGEEGLLEVLSNFYTCATYLFTCGEAIL